jgi:hypothetical protein
MRHILRLSLQAMSNEFMPRDPTDATHQKAMKLTQTVLDRRVKTMNFLFQEMLDFIMDQFRINTEEVLAEGIVQNFYLFTLFHPLNF